MDEQSSVTVYLKLIAYQTDLHSLWTVDAKYAQTNPTMQNITPGTR